MGDNSFAPYVVRAGYGQFVVLNIANPPKMVRIFQEPIYPFGSDGDTRDLLKTPGWSEADIRASLLKGEIRNKLLVWFPSGSRNPLVGDLEHNSEISRIILREKFLNSFDCFAWS